MGFRWIQLLRLFSMVSGLEVSRKQSLAYLVAVATMAIGFLLVEPLLLQQITPLIMARLVSGVVVIGILLVLLKRWST